MPVTEVYTLWALALALLAMGLWMLVRPQKAVRMQRWLLEKQIAILNGRWGPWLARLTGVLVLACGILIVTMLWLERMPRNGGACP